MKIAATIVAALLAVSPALAETEPFAEDDHICKKLGILAEQIMRNRQANVSMSDMMDASPLPVLKEMVLLAYDEPLYMSEDMKELEAKDFRNVIEVQCYREAMKQ